MDGDEEEEEGEAEDEEASADEWDCRAGKEPAVLDVSQLAKLTRVFIADPVQKAADKLQVLKV